VRGNSARSTSADAVMHAARAAPLRHRMADRLHRDVLGVLSPALLDVPLAGRPWHGQPRSPATVLTVPPRSAGATGGATTARGWSCTRSATCSTTATATRCSLLVAEHAENQAGRQAGDDAEGTQQELEGQPAAVSRDRRPLEVVDDDGPGHHHHRPGQPGPGDLPAAQVGLQDNASTTRLMIQTLADMAGSFRGADGDAAWRRSERHAVRRGPSSPDHVTFWPDWPRYDPAGRLSTSRASSTRERIPSLANACRRWVLTVSGDR